MSHLDNLLTLLRFPSISTDPTRKDDVRACALWLQTYCDSIGLSTELHETPGHPVLIARSAPRPGLPTVLIYGHYDVQPVDPLNLWLNPPFEPEIRDGRIYARGSTDNKGQHFAHLCGLADTLAEAGELPLNVIVLLEGEEEIGSPNLEPFLRAHADELRCDIIAVSDTGMVGPGTPTLTYGLRGIACLEFRVSGPATDLHSGIYGGGVMNPATAVARLVASLHDAEGRVAVEGFYDTVRDLQDWERAQWARLPDGDAATREETGVPEVFGESGYSSLERRWARPTVEVNGIWGGYQGAGSKTVIPREAFAKLSCRLVPDQDPQEVMAVVRAHLEKHCPPGVNVEIHDGHHGQWYVMDPMGPQGLAAQRALERTFGKPSLLIREGGSIPIIRSFRDVLGQDTLMLGLALPDCQAHAPNENFPVANFEAGILLNRHLLVELAQSLARPS